MTELSSVDLALFAFKRREQRFVLARIGIVYVLVSVALNAAFIALAWPALQEAFAWYVQVWRIAVEGGAPTAPPASLLMGLAPYWAALFVFGMMLFAALEAACLRWLVRGEATTFGLSFGADTWRVYAIYWLWLILCVVFVALIVALYVGLQFVAGLNPAMRIVTVLVGALAPLGLLALLIWVGVRLAPASAVSVARKQLSFFSAWSATCGWFWPLLGAFVLVLVGYVIVSTVLQALIRAPLGQVMYAPMQRAMTEQNVELLITDLTAAFSTPWVLAAIGAVMLASMVLALIYYISAFGVNARAAVAALEDGKITKAAA